MPAVDEAEDTPLLRQYRSLKASYPHAILLFRLGDFYEMFADDAKLASPILGVVLTHRQGLPMCGMPYHSYSQYAAKLLKAGHRVAVADQMEDPAQAKGIVRRQVTRLLTPGTLVEDELLGTAAQNYLVALEPDTVGWGLACVEVSTGEFWAVQALNDHGHLQLYSLLAKLDPAEVVLPPRGAEGLKLRQVLPHRTMLSSGPAADGRKPLDKLEVPAGWENPDLWRNRHLALKAALRARAYVAETQAHLRELPAPSYRESLQAMQLDEAAIRALELVGSDEGGKRHTLWDVLDRSRTPMGSRRLRSWILHPSTELPEIERRLNCVAELVEKPDARSRLQEALDRVADVERVINRLATRAASPRDLAALRDSLLQIHPLAEWAKTGEFDSGLAALASSVKALKPVLAELQQYLDKAVAEAPPARISDGGFIKDGFDAPLDELRVVKRDSRRILSELEERERRETGIASLKAGYNSVFGYYLEVTKTHQAKVPARFIRKQTLANAERYITPELKELEVKILGADDKALRLEAALFETVRTEVLGRSEAVRRFAVLAAELDVLAALAEAAAQNGYVKPTVDLSHVFEVEEGRHPIVEAALPAGTFVPNSVYIDGLDPQTLVLTGPNMGGKSVFLRQNALIAVMAQLGSFVPAKAARVGVVDRILTRIGARDQLARGESTFMVEMRETSHILKSATSRSLILLDEVGRGTSTYDGISIAWAVLEHLNKSGRRGEGPKAPRGPRVVFATHYFELTELAELLPGVRNLNVEAREWTTPEGKTEVVFLHKISPGPADRSFGIHVAELAGIPQACLARAREILHGLENEARSSPRPASAAEPTLPLFEEHPALQELRLLNPNDLTPLQALNKLNELKRKV